VRTDVPIHASDIAMRHAELIEGLPKDGVSEWIETISPEDFSQ